MLSKTALITGASSGIGFALANKLLSDGWRVIGFDIAPCAITHENFGAVKVDLCDTAAIQKACATLSVDAFIHAAGFMQTAPLGELDLAAGDAMWGIHAQAAAAVCNALAPAMQARGFRRIIFIGSRVAGGFPKRGQYAAVKAALIAMAKSWAAELAPHGVTVNVISPAATQTAMLQSDARASSKPKLPPIGRYIQPDEIAALAEFLLSDSAAAMTGQEILICGGASLAQ